MVINRGPDEAACSVQALLARRSPALDNGFREYKKSVLTRRRARLTVSLLAQAAHLQFSFSVVFLLLGSGHRICRQQRDCSRYGSEGEGDNVMRVSGQVFSSLVVGTTKRETQ